MRLKSAKIRNFKRFVDLKIPDLPADAKLIVLLGPNGCGKSSLFDALQRRLKVERFYGMNPELQRYYRRPTPKSNENDDTIEIDFHGGNPGSEYEFKKSLYMRTAYRHDPSFQQENITPQPDVLDRQTVVRLIDTDQTVQSNYQRIIWRLLHKVTTPGLTTDQIMTDIIGDLQNSMTTVFGDLQLDAVVSVEEKGTFTFTKGASSNFCYENLSGGEKAAFDLLLDIVVNRAAFKDSLYCIDEPEAHLGTKLQGRLLREMRRLVPDESQLWLATHSIGMVRTAQEIRVEDPEDILFLDMGFCDDGEPRDYDQPQIIKPAEPDHEFWRRHYAVALNDIAGLLAPDRIVLCEGSTQSDGPALDESCYNRIFAREFPQTRFISVGAKTNVEKRMGDLLPLLKQIVDQAKILRFRDRDDLTPEEIKDKRSQGVRVMSGARNLESMLLSNGVLSRLCENHDRPDALNAIQAARDNALCKPDGEHAADDLKPAAQAVHRKAATELNLKRRGETKHAFLRDVLAPLVVPETAEYASLRHDIFDD